MALIVITPEVIIAALLGLMMLASFVALRTKLPYTLILVFIGLIIAGSTVSRFIGASYITGLLQGPLFVSIIVPPLIFEAMIHIKSSDLRAVIRPASVLATLGVVIATIVCGLALWKIAGLPFYVSFLFAALISPTDSATVLGIFRSVKVPAKLSALIESEAAFNDATAIVSRTRMSTVEDQSHHWRRSRFRICSRKASGGNAAWLVMGLVFTIAITAIEPEYL